MLVQQHRCTENRISLVFFSAIGEIKLYTIDQYISMLRDFIDMTILAAWATERILGLPSYVTLQDRYLPRNLDHLLAALHLLSDVCLRSRFFSSIMPLSSL